MEWRVVFKSVVGCVAALWASLHPVIQLLLIAQAVDVVTGILAAVNKKQLSSKVSFRGITRKAVELLLVALAAAADKALNLGNSLPLFVAGFYAAHEAISILENAAECGLPVPQRLKSVFAKLQQESSDAELRSTD